MNVKESDNIQITIQFLINEKSENLLFLQDANDFLVNTAYFHKSLRPLHLLQQPVAATNDEIDINLNTA